MSANTDPSFESIASAAGHSPSLARRLGVLLLHMLWPVACPVCGRPGETLCGDCLASLLSPRPPRCLSCGERAPCPAHPDAPRIQSGAVYRGGVRDVIAALKYGGTRALGKGLGRGLALLWPAPEADLLLPVPLHLRSSRKYNQALEIARGLGRAWGIPAEDRARWAQDVPARAGLGRAERMALRPEAFDVPEDLRGLRVALVDDVCTTGSTLVCLASACRAAGARVAGAFTFASTGPEEDGAEAG